MYLLGFMTMAKKKNAGLKKYHVRMMIDIYSMARDGYNDKIIAKALGVTPAAFCLWKKKYKSVQYAFKKAEKDKKSIDNMDWTEYIKNRIPDHLKSLWNEISQYDSNASGYEMAQQLLHRKSRRIRQDLLCHAILACNFNLTKALRKVGVARCTFVKWMENDPEFVELLNEVREIKQDLFEEGLIRLVRAGDSPAIIFANRTVNRKRGYGEHVSTSFEANINVTSLPLHELDLAPEILRALMEAMNKRKQIAANVIEAKQIAGETE